MSTTRRRSLFAAIVSGVLLAATIGSATASAAGTRSTLEWSACYVELGPFECASLSVPLDYDRPTGSTISIAMVRLPAAKPNLRQGSLFLNPGGPGGSGVEFAVFAGRFLFTQAVRDRFDLVGFDPRGVMRSNPLRCFNSPDEWTPYFTDFAFPITRAELREWVVADRFLDRACEQRGGPILNHMSTANVARDLDRMRAAVGDPKLTYYGVSYGSMIGQTYANMFPGRFRAVVIDGVLDPIAWTAGAPGQRHLPFSTRIRSDAGAMTTLRQFFRLCDAGGSACVFSGGAAARYAALAARLRAEPLVITDPDTGEVFEYNYSVHIANTLGAMYSSFSWPDFANLLAALESLAAPAASRALGAFRRSAGLVEAPFPEFPEYPNFVEGGAGVACSDSTNPDSYNAWWTAGIQADARFGYFGRFWTWVSSICAEWPGADSDRYLGPWNRRTAAPVLVVGNRFDPATRYQGAVIAHGLLPNSALLTVNGWGHTSLFLSGCAEQAIAAYLIRLRTPRPGTVCQQDEVPWVDFGPTPAGAVRAAGAQEAPASVRSLLIPFAVRRVLN